MRRILPLILIFLANHAYPSQMTQSMVGTWHYGELEDTSNNNVTYMAILDGDDAGIVSGQRIVTNLAIECKKFGEYKIRVDSKRIIFSDKAEGLVRFDNDNPIQVSYVNRQGASFPYTRNIGDMSFSRYAVQRMRQIENQKIYFKLGTNRGEIDLEFTLTDINRILDKLDTDCLPKNAP